MGGKYGYFCSSGNFYEIVRGVAIPKDYRLMGEVPPGISIAPQMRRMAKREQGRATGVKMGGNKRA